MNERSFRFYSYINKQIMKDKRTAILQATLEMITELGFHGTAMSKLADRAGVGAGTIYRYFKNKEDLINILFRELKKDMDEATFEGYSDSLPIKLQFKLVWKNVLLYYIQHPKIFKFIEQHYYSPFIDEETKKERTQLHQPITAFFEQFKQTKLIKNLPIDVLYALVYGPIVSLAKFHLEADLVLEDVVLDRTMEACWEAITV